MPGPTPSPVVGVIIAAASPTSINNHYQNIAFAEAIVIPNLQVSPMVLHFAKPVCNGRILCDQPVK